MTQKEMTKEEIEKISRWACQSRRFVWRKWLELLLPLGVSAEQLREYKPAISEICEPLMGRMVKEKNEKGEDVFVNRLPSIDERRAIYAEALEIIRWFGSYEDLIRVAAYRRQVSEGDLEDSDSLLFTLVAVANPALKQDRIRSLANRMPPTSLIRQRLCSCMKNYENGLSVQEVAA